MSRKNIRVTWDELKPGDLIHVKGSNNTYKFDERSMSTNPQHEFITVKTPGLHPGRAFVMDDDFDYATRPAPKPKRPEWPRIPEPGVPGEYWILVGSDDHPLGSMFVKVIRRGSLPTDMPANVPRWMNVCLPQRKFRWTTWNDLAPEGHHIVDAMTAAEFYTRQANGTLASGELRNEW